MAAPGAMPHIKSGRGKVIGITTAKKPPLDPSWATPRDAGIPDLGASIGVGLFAPKGTPQAVVDRVNKEVRETLSSPRVVHNHLSCLDDFHGTSIRPHSVGGTRHFSWSLAELFLRPDALRQARELSVFLRDQRAEFLCRRCRSATIRPYGLPAHAGAGAVPRRRPRLFPGSTSRRSRGCSASRSPRPTAGSSLDRDPQEPPRRRSLRPQLSAASRGMIDRTALRAFVFDSLEEQIAVVDQAGAIVEVNAAWTSFGVENGLAPGFDFAGCNYLDVVDRAFTAGDEHAREAAQGISDVLSGRRASFYYEYPCHTPVERRWFMMRVSRLTGKFERMFVISHYNITQRKLAEERAEHMARHDSLTGLANRRYFSEFMSLELRRSIRERSTISLVLMDVDYFKDYNDELGHLAGDQCLAAVAEVLPAFARRPGDLAARLGGDEFALILGNTALAESRTIAEAIREAVSDLKLAFGESRQVTVSVGVACATPDGQQMEDFLFQEADRALYAAKSAGRNRVAHAQ